MYENMNYLYLIISWIVYFSLHSVFALSSVKNAFYSIGLNPQKYRLIFNIFGLVLLIPIFIISSFIESSNIFSPNKIIKFAGLLFAGWGIVVIKIAFKSYDTKAFLGLANLDVENEFKTDGILKTVRHPLYSGSILLIFGYFLFDPKLSTLISSIMLILYIIIGIQFEERKLIKTFGNKYIEYKQKTPMLIPRFWKKS